MDKKFDVSGMTCSACSAAVERQVSRLPGVTKVQVNLLNNNMSVSFDESALDSQGIIAAV